MTAVEATAAAKTKAFVAVSRLAQLGGGDGGGGDGCVGRRLTGGIANKARGFASTATGGAFQCSNELEHSAACGTSQMAAGSPNRRTGQLRRRGTEKEGSARWQVTPLFKLSLVCAWAGRN